VPADVARPRNRLPLVAETARFLMDARTGMKLACNIVDGNGQPTKAEHVQPAGTVFVLSASARSLCGQGRWSKGVASPIGIVDLS
jgi:hypothetical protein